MPSQIELKDKISTLQRALTRQLNNELNNLQKQLSRLQGSYAFRYPEQLIKQKEQALDNFVEGLQRATLANRKEKEIRLVNLNKRLVTQHPKKQLEQSIIKLRRKNENTTIIICR